MKKRMISFVAMSALSITLHAFANDNVNSSEASSQSPWKVTLGPGLMIKPDFLGSDDYQLVFAPAVGVNYEDTFFASLQDGFGYNAINSNGFKAGPLATYVGARPENNHNTFRIAGKRSNALEGLGTVSSTIDAGGFVSYTADAFTIKATLLQALTQNHGLTADIEANYSNTFDSMQRTFTYSVGPHAEWANAKHNNTYFGINEKQSTNSGLAQYSASSGLAFYGLKGTLSTPLTSTSSLLFLAEYDRLGSETADSPLVTQRGAKNQFILGTMYFYSF